MYKKVSLREFSPLFAKLLYYFAKFRHNFADEYREKIAQNFAKHVNFGGLDPGHVTNQIEHD
jgi:hypothetical protein